MDLHLPIQDAAGQAGRIAWLEKAFHAAGESIGKLAGELRYYGGPQMRFASGDVAAVRELGRKLRETTGDVRDKGRTFVVDKHEGMYRGPKRGGNIDASVRLVDYLEHLFKPNG